MQGGEYNWKTGQKTLRSVSMKSSNLYLGLWFLLKARLGNLSSESSGYIYSQHFPLPVFQIKCFRGHEVCQNMPSLVPAKQEPCIVEPCFPRSIASRFRAQGKPPYRTVVPPRPGQQDSGMDFWGTSIKCKEKFNFPCAPNVEEY